MSDSPASQDRPAFSLVFLIVGWILFGLGIIGIGNVALSSFSFGSGLLYGIPLTLLGLASMFGAYLTNNKPVRPRPR